MTEIDQDAKLIANVLKNHALICENCSKVVTNPIIHMYERSTYTYEATLEIVDFDEIPIYSVEVDDETRKWHDCYESHMEEFRCEHCGHEVYFSYDEIYWALEEY
jgi:hypothetical protein